MSTRRALFLGLNRYQSGVPALQAPANDAQALYRLFREYSDFEKLDLWPRKAGKAQDPVEADPDGQLTKSEIQSLVKNLFVGDTEQFHTAFFFFSGHGSRKRIENELTGEIKQESYLCSSDDQYAIPLSDLRTLVKMSKALEKIVWLDCCHSGDVLDFASVFKEQNGLFLASSQPSESSYELHDHGILTQAILDGLNNCLEQYGRVTGAHLIAYLQDYLPGQIQTFGSRMPKDTIELIQRSRSTHSQATQSWSLDWLHKKGVELDEYFDYLRALREDCQRLPLDTIDPTPENPVQRLRLSQVYFDLNLVKTVHKPLPGQASLSPKAPGGNIGGAALQTIVKTENRLAVLRGVLGSGKSTLINNLVSHLCNDILQEKHSNLDMAMDGLIPVRLLLGQMTNLIPGEGHQGNARLIWQLIESDLGQRYGKTTGQHLFKTLKNPLRSHGVFMLDGLDEVPEKGQQRRRLLEAVDAFTAELGERAHILLTSRPHAFSDDERRSKLGGFQVLDLSPLSADQIDQFVETWFRAALPVLGWDHTTFHSRLHALQSVLHARTDLVELASRPLLLTLIISLQTTTYTKLPGDRADLFEEVVKLLLTRWQRILVEKFESSTPLLLPQLVNALHTNPDRIRAGLENLAFRLHKRQQAEQEREEPSSDMQTEEAQGLFSTFVPENINPKEVLAFFEERAGLLIRQSNGHYAFPHRSFQEYLAACHLVDRGTVPRKELVDHVQEDLHWWRDVFLLALGKIRRGSMANALEILMTLVPEPWTEETAVSEWQWWATVLGGQGLLELRVTERAPDSPLTKLVMGRMIDWLARLVDLGMLSPQERSEAGDILGQLGDPRSGVDLDDEGLPEINWVVIPGGDFSIGRGVNQRSLRMDTFHIARYPVTVAQYAAFIAAKGYEQKRLWTSRGWQWRKAMYRFSPSGWREQESFRNRPVVGVSWYEAMAFCEWLRGIRNQNIRLPTGEEWEYAARGQSERPYPWSDSEQWDTEHSNSENSGIRHPTTVGMYVIGATPEGVYDLGGNAWEWCRNLYREVRSMSDDWLDDPQATGRRSARGGSWWSSWETNRCEYRRKFEPASSDPDMGFRLVLF